MKKTYLDKFISKNLTKMIMGPRRVKLLKILEETYSKSEYNSIRHRLNPVKSSCKTIYKKQHTHSCRAWSRSLERESAIDWVFSDT